MPHKFPENLPVLPYKTVEDIPMEVINELREQQAQEQEQAALKNAEKAVERDYETLLADARNALGRNEGVAICRKPGYEGIAAYYDLSVEFDRALVRPWLRERLKGESLAVYAATAVPQYKRVFIEWIPIFVLRIEPFELTTRDGEPLPNPQEDSTVYEDLARDHSEFAKWLAYDGFDEAVKGAIKNSPKTSPLTTTKS